MKQDDLMLEIKRLKALLEQERLRVEQAEIKLTHQNALINKLQRELYCRGNEKRVVCILNPNQTDLFTEESLREALENEILAQQAATQSINTSKPKNTPKRKALPENIERVEDENDLEEAEKNCPCCQKPMKCIGYETSERLEYIPARFVVFKQKTLKYACKDHPEEGVFYPHLAPKLIKKGIPGSTLVAHVLISKYMDHQPLDRLVKIFDRSGVQIAKSTLCGWLKSAQEALEPVYEKLAQKVLDSAVIQADETTFKVQQNSQKLKPIKGYVWAYVGDKKWIWCRWHSGRDAGEPKEFLADYKNKYLQCDAYAGYNSVVKMNNLKRLGCMAHARRKFVEAFDQKEKLAQAPLELISSLYEIEKRLRENPTLDVLEIRKKEAIPILESLKSKITQLAPLFTPKSLMGEATRYFLNEYEHLKGYTENAELEIDNNRTERVMRPIALGRKNYLFAGSEGGAHRAAEFYSLIETAKNMDVNPWNYICHLLQCIDENGKCKPILPDEFKEITEERKAELG